MYLYGAPLSFPVKAGLPPGTVLSRDCSHDYQAGPMAVTHIMIIRLSCTKRLGKNSPSGPHRSGRPRFHRSAAAGDRQHSDGEEYTYIFRQKRHAIKACQLVSVSSLFRFDPEVPFRGFGQRFPFDQSPDHAPVCETTAAHKHDDNDHPRFHRFVFFP